MSYLASAVIADTRTVTDQTTGVQVTDAQLLPLLDDEYQRLRRHISDLVPDLYTAVSADFSPTVTGAVATQDVTAAPMSVTDLLKIRTVEVKNGNTYSGIAIAPVLTSGNVGYLCWRQRGAKFIDMYPAASLGGKVFRMKYIQKAARLTVTSDPLDIPDGAAGILRERLAVNVRSRQEEQDVHTAKAKELWVELRNSLLTMYPSTPSVIEDVTGRW